MSDAPAPDAWCRERLMVPGNPLAVSLPYAPERLRPGLLALHAVIGEIAAIPGGVSDPGVGMQKLGWWRDQVTTGSTRHPAMQALSEHAPAMLTPMTAELWSGLIEGAAETLDNPRFERFEYLWSHCAALGGTARMLEARLVEIDTDIMPWREMGAAGYLLRVVRDVRIDAAAHRWLIPLDVQAAWQVDRQQVAGGTPGLGFDGLIRDLVERAITRSHDAEAGLGGHAAWRHRHGLILAALDRRLAARLHHRPRRLLDRRILPGQGGNAWRAWRTARRLRKARRDTGGTA